MQPEEHQELVGAQRMPLAVRGFYIHAGEAAVLDDERVRQRLHMADAPCRGEFAQARDRGGYGAKIRAPMHEGERARLRGELEGPVKRRIAAAKNDQLLAMQVRRAAHAVVNVLILEGLCAFKADAPRLKRADSRGDDDRARIEGRPGRGADLKAPRFEFCELAPPLTQMKLRRKGLDLLHQPIDQLLRVAHGQRRDVIDRLVRIQLRALSARMRQGIDDMRADAEEPELEGLEKAAGACADDDDVRSDGLRGRGG